MSIRFYFLFQITLLQKVNNFNNIFGKTRCSFFTLMLLILILLTLLILSLNLAQWLPSNILAYRIVCFGRNYHYVPLFLTFSADTFEIAKAE